MPNSILWIGLVVLWVFVLFPILADRHPRIRQTTDAALATRVLHRGGSKRRLRYRPNRARRKRFHSDDAEDRMSTPADEKITDTDDDAVTGTSDEAGHGGTPSDSDIADSAPREPDSPDADASRRARGERDGEIDADADDSADAEIAEKTQDGEKARVAADSDDEPAADEPGHGRTRAESSGEDGRAASDEDDTDEDATADDHAAPGHEDEPRPRRERVTARIPPARSAVPVRAPEPAAEYDAQFDQAGEDRAGFDHAEDSADEDEPDFVPTRRGRGGYDPEADAIARAARYTFRQRAVLALLLTAIMSGALALILTPLFWWACGLSVVVLATYLAYLRKQVRMEEEIRRRRAARLARRRGEPVPEQADDHEDDEDEHATARGGMDRATARALRRRSSLLDVDDEDPLFEHLEAFDPAAARALRHRTGTDMRRAVGE
ncbi:divisome protein SepX/GlpR [Nocardia farcinica]